MKNNVIVALISALLLGVLSSVAFSNGDKKHWPVISPEVLNEFDARVNALAEQGFVFKMPVPHAHLADGPGGTTITIDTLGQSTYDFAWNHVADQQVAPASGGSFDGIHMVYMKKTAVVPANTTRFATYSFYSRLIGDFLGEFVPTNQGGSGWPRVVDGPNHEGVYVYHLFGSPTDETHFRVDDGEGFLTFGVDAVVDPSGTWPGVDINGSTLVVTTTRRPESIPGRTFVSTDMGATWTEIGWPGVAIPGTVEHGSAETSPSINPTNPSQIGMVNSETDNGAVPHGGLTMNVSADMQPATTWTNTVVYEFGTLLPDNSFYDPGAGLTTHHFNGVYGADGTFHVAFNGAGQQLNSAGDTLFPIFPAVYWNSADQQLIEVSDPAISRNPLLADSINTYWPGRGLGLAYENVATAPGGAVLVAWQQPELAAPDQLRYAFGNLGANVVKVFATDIYAALSLDNGQSWTSAFKLAGEDGQMDLFPQIALENRPDGLHVQLIYLYDSNPGESVGGESDISVCAWVYNDILLPTTGIGDGDPNVAGSFQLRQNYPNPFNPGTQISFTLSRSAEVNLTVYSVTGQKVATLLNEQRSAGEHTVQFDGSNLASGIYLYTLKAGNAAQTRKMILMK